MKGMLSVLAAFVMSLACAADAVSQGFPAGHDESKDYQAEIIVDKLDNPSGLALRPVSTKDSPAQIFFAESGAGRILNFAASNPAATKVVVSGFATRPLNKTIDVRVGPWALGFVTPTKLAVLGGVQKQRAEQVGVFVLPEADKELTVDQLDHMAELTDGYDEKANIAFPGVAMNDTTAYFAIGSASMGTLLKSIVSANRIDSPRPLVSSNVAQSLSWPSGLCLSPAVRTQFLVGSYLGELSEQRDSLIVFVVPSSGSVVMRLAPGLFDVVGLAYSPSGQLYAVDFAWQEENQGGVYRLDDARLDGQPACRAVKIASIDHPTSILFDESGSMYVTSLGSGTNAKHGKIIKITGSF